MKVENYNLGLFMVLVLGAIARFWAIDFGLPNIKCRPDESFIINTAMKFGSGDLNPHTFLYPTLYMYMLFFLFIIYYVIGTITGRFTSSIDFLYEYSTDPGNFYLIARCFTAFLGTATIYVVYALCRKVFDRTNALVSAFLFSICYLHIRDSHFATTDVPTVFFIVSAVYFIVCTYQSPSFKNYLASGVLIGLATSSKYNGILLLLPLLGAHLFAHQYSLSFFKNMFHPKLLMGLLAICLVIFITSPFVFLDFETFISDFSFQMRHLRKGHVLKKDIGYLYHFYFSLFYGIGWPMLLAAVAGLIIKFKSDLKLSFMVFGFPLLYYGAIGGGYSLFVRYIIPVLPFLCIAASCFVVWTCKQLTNFIRINNKKVILTLLSALVSSVSIYNVFCFDRLIGKEDNRLLASAWAVRNIPNGSSVCQSASWGEIGLSPDIETIQHMEAHEENATKKKILLRKLDEQSIFHASGYKAWEIKDTLFTWQDEPQTTLPDYIVIEKYPLVFLTRIPDFIPELVKHKYQLIKTFKAIDMQDSGNLFDQEDAFYLPFAGFHNTERPGPNLYIYRKNDRK